MSQSTQHLPLLQLDDCAEITSEIVVFLSKVFQLQAKQTSVIAVSGGIDSAVSLSLLVKALPKKNVFPLLLPYGNQDMSDAQEICMFNQIPSENVQSINIKTIVDAFDQNLKIEQPYRLGNVMARVRMIVLYDFAKKLDALVCGTENKSEKYLAYYTRFGDEASDIEPIVHLYKTQVRQLAEHLKLPAQFLRKPPSAGLWEGQSDENELGFSYQQADLVMQQYIDEGKSESEIHTNDLISQSLIRKVIHRIQSQQFKQLVPYYFKR